MASIFRPTLRLGSMAVLAFILVTQFINCGQYTSPTATTTENSVLTCDDTTCVTPDPDNLKIVFNLNGSSQFTVAPNVADFNLGGDCNEGGYPYSTIYWELYLNNVKVRDSNMAGINASNPSAAVNTSCVNGRFSVYVNMNAITQDPVNRVFVAGGPQYDLYATIIGRPTPATAGYTNTLTGRTHVTLMAVSP